MGYYTGRTAALRFKGKPVAKVQNWSLETSVQLLPTDDLGSDANTFTPGKKGATGSATMIYYRLESGENATKTEFTSLLNQIQKKGPILPGNRVELDLVVDSSPGATLDNIRCNAYINSCVLSSAPGELSIVPFQFTVDGDFIDVIE
jgi:hypothetical protein